MANQIDLQKLIGSKIVVIELVPFDKTRSHIQSITVEAKNGDKYKIGMAWYGDQRDGQETMIAQSPDASNILTIEEKSNG